MSESNYDETFREIRSKLVNIESMLDFLTKHFTLSSNSKPKKRAYNKSASASNAKESAKSPHQSPKKASVLIETYDDKLESARANQNGRMMIVDDESTSPAMASKPNASKLADKKDTYITLNDSSKRSTRLSNNRSITKVSANVTSSKNRPTMSKVAELEEKLTRAPPQSKGLDLRELLLKGGMKEKSSKKLGSHHSDSSVFTMASTRSERYMAKKMIMRQLMDNMERNIDAYELRYDGRAYVLPLKKNQPENAPAKVAPDAEVEPEMAPEAEVAPKVEDVEKKSFSYDMFGGF